MARTKEFILIKDLDMKKIEVSRDEMKKIITEARSAGEDELAHVFEADESIFEKIFAKDKKSVRIIYCEDGEVRLKNRPDGLERFLAKNRFDSFGFVKGVIDESR
ncbi:MAG: hypothetical protein BAJALOKI1v1_2440003 [Promethearchaeota archaeon]|nr:MAG: hypothetical protein BAJALOKI1v1_2440003 [Candidatus Lokiarchaeota archaeon]